MSSDQSNLCKEIASELPSEYEFLEVLGEGGFGQVLKCRKRDTGQIVAVKFPKEEPEDTIEEVSMMRRIKHHGIEKHNIVEFIDDFPTKLGPALVFEALDISLYDYMSKEDTLLPMRLSDIRTIIQQMATALDALKGIGVIHADLKLDNIMMVNHQLRPFELKLIDFGLALSRSETKQGEAMQPYCLRAPEIILGLPFSEAIDMWSLGCEMFAMVCGQSMCDGDSEYETLQCIVELLGQPADHLLNAGLMTEEYFERTDSTSWEFKTPEEYFGDDFKRTDKYNEFQSLDDLKEMLEEENNEAEAVEREHCVELLKAMLKIDPNERITPQEVLCHPFITQNYPKCVSSTSSNDDFKCEPPATPLNDEDSINIQPDNSTPSPEINPSGVILVQPVTVENTLLLEDEESDFSFHSELDEMSDTTPLISEDSITYEDTRTKKKKKKKKNGIKRFFSWMRKAFCRCATYIDDD